MLALAKNVYADWFNICAILNYLSVAHKCQESSIWQHFGMTLTCQKCQFYDFCEKMWKTLYKALQGEEQIKFSNNSYGDWTF